MRLLSLSTILLLTACGTTDTTDTAVDTAADTASDTAIQPVDAAIVGTFVDDFGNTHIINQSTWEMSADAVPATDTTDAIDAWSSSFAISQFNQDSSYLIAQNADTNAFNAGEWSRFDWFVDTSDELWYCQTSYNSATEADALAVAPANVDALATDGCGGFSWSTLTTQ